jgi:phosphatidylserine/phosphatidylglycerophosphate/cardiolipin synthase-like enzyme
MKLNKEAVYLGLIIILIALCGQFYYSFKWKPARDIQVYYNRDIRTSDKIVKMIQEADQFVYFAIYTFTLPEIKDALLGAKYRGLDVRGLTDANQTAQIENQRKLISELREAGIPVAVQSHSAIMHLKTLVTDKGYISGSYNWTKAATEDNDEIIEVGIDNHIREQYQNILENLFRRYPAY